MFRGLLFLAFLSLIIGVFIDNEPRKTNPPVANSIKSDFSAATGKMKTHRRAADQGASAAGAADARRRAR